MQSRRHLILIPVNASVLSGLQTIRSDVLPNFLQNEVHSFNCCLFWIILLRDMSIFQLFFKFYSIFAFDYFPYILFFKVYIHGLFLLLIHLFSYFYLWLHWVFAAMCSLPLEGEGSLVTEVPVCCGAGLCVAVCSVRPGSAHRLRFHSECPAEHAGPKTRNR